ncbi:MAG TPA: LytR C-terminal domain-containing protein [Candidatus Paceibacterota bacterium]
METDNLANNSLSGAGAPAARRSISDQIKEAARTFSWRTAFFPIASAVIALIILVLFLVSSRTILTLIQNMESDGRSTPISTVDAQSIETVAHKVGIVLDLSATSTPPATVTPGNATPGAATSASITPTPALRIEILNGTGRSGLAGQLKTLFEQAGFAVAQTGNAPATRTTAVRLKSDAISQESAIMAIVGKQYPGATTEALPDTSTYDVVVVIGG